MRDLPYNLLPEDAIEEVVKVLKSGAQKYAPRDWEKGYSWDEFYGAMLHHATRWHRRVPQDKDSGLSHMAHVACRALMLLAYELRKAGTDDRPGSAPSGLSHNNSTKTGTVLGSASRSGGVSCEPGPEVAGGDSGDGSGGSIRYVSPWTRADREDAYAAYPVRPEVYIVP